METENDANAYDMIFGLNRVEDERSLVSFLNFFGNKRLTEVLVPRMTDDDIRETVSFLTKIMHKHLSEKEYHTLFLGDENHNH